MDIHSDTKAADRAADRVACAMMVKDEADRIHVTLRSVLPHVDSVVLHDTGSTDSTVAIVEKMCSDAGVECHVLQGKFVNFSVNRNMLLSFADDKADWLLLMDCNDELRGGREMKQWIAEYHGGASAFMLNQQWFHGTSHNDYWNVRLIKTNEGWFYKGAVHEWICNDDTVKDALKTKIPGVVIYQDRTKGCGGSTRRFHRDKEILMKQHLAAPNDARTLFYLAQTFECLGDTRRAKEFYVKRTRAGGFREEVFEALMRLYRMDKSEHWLWEALKHSPHRAEPYVEFAKIHVENRKLAWFFISQACRLDFPEDFLFIDKNVWEWERWHVAGIVAWYVGELEEGRRACHRALAIPTPKDIDRRNLEWYKK